MNDYQLSLSDSCLNCLDSLVLQSSVHILLQGCLQMSINLEQLLDIMGLEQKIFLDLWLYLLNCEIPATKPWVSLLFSLIPGMPYEPKLHFSILALHYELSESSSNYANPWLS